VQVLRAEALHLRARAALAVAAQPGKRENMLRLAERDAQALVDQRARWIQPFASLIRAAIASRRAPDEVLPLLRAAISGFDAASMRLYSAAATRRLGQYAGGDHGRELIASSDSFMRRELIQDPARFAFVLAPGFAIDDG
jgi:eukaryotic-like serine/threonine-protein kinase